MQDDSTPKRVFLFIPTGTRRLGRPRKRWADSAKYDFLLINEKNGR